MAGMDGAAIAATDAPPPSSPPSCAACASILRFLTRSSSAAICSRIESLRLGGASALPLTLALTVPALGTARASIGPSEGAEVEATEEAEAR